MKTEMNELKEQEKEMGYARNGSNGREVLKELLLVPKSVFPRAVIAK